MSTITQVTLLDGVSATGSGTEQSIPAYAKYRVYQVEITGTATVTISGRIDSALSWDAFTDMTSITASGVYQATHAIPLVKAEVTAYTSGTVTVKAIGVP